MSDDRHPIDLIVDEFVAEWRGGRNPTVDAYLSRYPEHQAVLQSILPSIELVERAAKRVDATIPGTATPTPLPQTGRKRLGEFEILRLIGRGGMGVVYEAVQHSLNRRVALKIINSGEGNSPQQQIRFRREAEAAASLHHTNIVPVFGSGEDQGYLYFAMQLIDGVPLNEVIDWLRKIRTGRPSGRSDGDADQTVVEEKTVELTSSTSPRPRTSCSVAEAAQSLINPTNHGLTSPDSRDPYYRNVARVMADVAAALKHAHHQGMVHRDIKPSNLILDREGTIWVSDFGLARRDDVEGMTQTGEVIGTLRYMAPEQFHGQADPRTDLFSLGLTLYELLTLQCAFPQPRSRAMTGDSVTVIRDVKRCNPQVPADLRTITMKACALEPSDRYQTAAALEEDLRRFLDDRPILARRISSLESLWRWSRRNPLLASLATLVMALLASMVVMLSMWNRQATADLNRIQTENRRAERSLAEKTSALQLAQQERTRAENNLQLAVEAFDTVIENISARGTESWNWSEMVDDEDLFEFPEVPLTDADVVLLETLLKFFERFSAENSQQLLEQTALARRRVGDLQKHLGRYPDAEASYQQAANAYRELERKEEGKLPWIIAQAEILIEQQWLAAQRREHARALKYFEQARQLIEHNDDARSSPEGRFALAKVLSGFASLGPGQLRLVRPRPIETVRRLADINQEAVQLLSALQQEYPQDVAYRVTLARSLKSDMALASALQDPVRAERAMQEAVKIMEGLIGEYPDSPMYPFELAEILCTNLSPRPRDQGRFLRAKGLAEDLVKNHPQNHKYRSLLAFVLSRVALAHWHTNRFDSAEKTLNEVIHLQRRLTEEVPRMVAYQVQYVQSLRMLANWQNSQKRHDEAKQTLALAAKAAESFAPQGKARNPLQEILQKLRAE